MEVNTKLSSALSYLRRKAGLTQIELARKLGYSAQSVVSAWESGAKMPPARILPKLALVLNCTIDDLFRDTPA